jgi:uncharacterized cofD-like protein
VSGVAAAIEKSSATRVYISNVMTQPGETRDYTLADHARAIQQHAGRKLLDWVVINNGPIAPEMARRYRNHGAEPVAVDVGELQRMGLRCMFDSLIEAHGVIRHDAKRLARLLLEEFVQKRPPA